MRAHPKTAVARLAALTLLSGIAATPAHAAGGLQLIPEVAELVTLFVLFALLIFPLNALIFRPIFGVLDEREERIAGARRRGEQLETEAAQIVARYEGEVREVRESSERERRESLDRSRDERATIADAARSEAEAEIERGRMAIASSLDEARTTLRAGAEQLASQAAERILGRSL